MALTMGIANEGWMRSFEEISNRTPVLQAIIVII